MKIKEISQNLYNEILKIIENEEVEISQYSKEKADEVLKDIILINDKELSKKVLEDLILCLTTIYCMLENEDAIV